MERFDKAMQATQRAYDFLVSEGYNVLSVNLYGSQNYDLDTPESDYDFKALVFPSLDDMVLGRPQVSKVLDFGGGQVDVKGAAKMFENYKKMNTNFMETLFTRWYVVNPDYAADWEAVRALAPRLAYADPAKAMNALVGMAMEKAHALTHPYEGKLQVLAEHGYDGKQLSHELRLLFMFDKYAAHMPYEQVLMPSAEQREQLVALKLWKPQLKVEEARRLSKLYVDQLEAKKKVVFDRGGLSVDTAVFGELDTLLMRMLKKSVVKEVKAFSDSFLDS